MSETHKIKKFSNWLTMIVWRASVPKCAELSPAPLLSLYGKQVWLVSQNGVRSHTMVSARPGCSKILFDFISCWMHG
jgi:hypothetical protein